LDAGHPNLAGWLKKAEALWKEHGVSDMTLIQRWNYHNGLSSQFPIAPIRVLYAASGTLPCATILVDERAVIEHKLYWAPTETLQEARYLAAILGSETVRSKVAGLQSRGQWGARDFDKVVFTLGFPRFDSKNELHKKLVTAASDAEKIANEVELPEGLHFQTARRRIREALSKAGASKRIDVLVARLIAGKTN
jgi:hypothetical protein